MSWLMLSYQDSESSKNVLQADLVLKAGLMLSDSGRRLSQGG